MPANPPTHAPIPFFLRFLNYGVLNSCTFVLSGVRLCFSFIVISRVILHSCAFVNTTSADGVSRGVACPLFQIVACGFGFRSRSRPPAARAAQPHARESRQRRRAAAAAAASLPSRSKIEPAPASCDREVRHQPAGSTTSQPRLRPDPDPTE